MLDGSFLPGLFFRPGAAELYLRGLCRPAEAVIVPGFVLGRVELAGKIIEHEHGYRAQRVRIAELFPVEGTERTIRSLAAQLGLLIGPSVEAPFRPLDLEIREAPRLLDGVSGTGSVPRRRSLTVGAGEGNRTLTTSLEGWSS